MNRNIYSRSSSRRRSPHRPMARRSSTTPNSFGWRNSSARSGRGIRGRSARNSRRSSEGSARSPTSSTSWPTTSAIPSSAAMAAARSAARRHRTWTSWPPGHAVPVVLFRGGVLAVARRRDDGASPDPQRSLQHHPSRRGRLRPACRRGHHRRDPCPASATTPASSASGTWVARKSTIRPIRASMKRSGPKATRPGGSTTGTPNRPTTSAASLNAGSCTRPARRAFPMTRAA